MTQELSVGRIKIQEMKFRRESKGQEVIRDETLAHGSCNLQGVNSVISGESSSGTSGDQPVRSRAVGVQGGPVDNVWWVAADAAAMQFDSFWAKIAFVRLNRSQQALACVSRPETRIRVLHERYGTLNMKQTLEVLRQRVTLS